VSRPYHADVQLLGRLLAVSTGVTLGVLVDTRHWFLFIPLSIQALASGWLYRDAQLLRQGKIMTVRPLKVDEIDKLREQVLAYDFEKDARH